MLEETQGNGGKQRVKSLRSEFEFFVQCDLGEIL
jgi:hypothetical protein